MECEVTAKTYEQLEVVPGAVRAAGDMELNQQTLGFYMDALTTAMIAEHAMGAAQPMTLITGAENVKVTKAAGQTWAAGQWVYWDQSSENFTTIAASDRFCVGKAQRLAANGAVAGFIVLQDNFHPVQIGTDVVPISIPASSPLIDVHATSAVTAGGIDAASIKLVYTGNNASPYVKGLRVTVNADVKAGATCRAIYGKVDFLTNGCAQGLASAICGEMNMATVLPTSGSYAAIEGYLGYNVAQPNLCTSFMKLECGGIAKAAFDDHGYLMDLHVGAAEAGHIFNEEGDKAGTGGIRFRLNGVNQWFLISNTAP